MFDFFEPEEPEEIMAQVHTTNHPLSRTPIEAEEEIYVENEGEGEEWTEGQAPFIIAPSFDVEFDRDGPSGVFPENDTTLYYRASKGNYVAMLGTKNLPFRDDWEWLNYAYEAIVELASPIIHCGLWTEDVEGLEPSRCGKTEDKKRIYDWLLRSARDAVQTMTYLLHPDETERPGVTVWGEFMPAYDHVSEAYDDVEDVVPTREWFAEAEKVIPASTLDDFVDWLDSGVEEEGSSDEDVWRAWNAWRGFPVHLFDGLGEDYEDE